MERRINPLFLIGLLGMLTIGTNFVTNLYRAVWGEQDIWWTPQTMRLSIDETENHFELYIGGESLSKILSEGTRIVINYNGEQYPINEQDISVRLNNWDKIKASFLLHATISGVVFGVMIVLFVIGLLQVFGKTIKSP